jgi:hypothetical protein
MSSGLIAAAEGNFGYSIPDSVKERVRSNNLFLWPLMAFIWGFNPEVVAERSLISKWIRDCEYYEECNIALENERRALKEKDEILPVANVPSHEQILAGRFGSPENTRDVVITTKAAPSEEEEDKDIVTCCIS